MKWVKRREHSAETEAPTAAQSAAAPVLSAYGDEGTWDDPSEDVLGDLLASLSLRRRFLVVERLDRDPEGRDFMQVYLHDDFSYQVEYREDDLQYQAFVPPEPGVAGYDQVTRVFLAWAFDQPGWREELPWTVCLEWG